MVSSFLFYIDSASVRKQALLLEEVQKLNRENAERSISSTASEAEEPLSQNLLDFILDQAKVPVVELLPDSQESSIESVEEEEKAEEEKAEEEEAEEKAEEEKAEEEKAEDIQDEADEMVDKSEEELKEVVEEENKEENSAMVDVMEAENTVAPQRYPV